MSKPDETTWVLVAAGFHQRGGMDKANYALAQYLSESGRSVHLVSHDVDDSLLRIRGVKATLVKRPANSMFLGEFVLDRAARATKKRLLSTGHQVRVLANGSNCLIGDINWVHYVHGAWQPSGADVSFPVRARYGVQGHILRSRERIAFRRANLILTNSELTTRHVAGSLTSNFDKIKTVYLGADPLFPISEDERSVARVKWNLSGRVPVVAFVGALGLDSRKGFDVLMKAWQILCMRTGWDAQLLVAGDGPALGRYRKEAEQSGVSGSIRFLGFRTDIDSVLAASDVLVSPVRYESYGLNVQEALSRGLAVVTSASAGIAERFSGELTSLLIRDPESVDECVEKILRWRSDRATWSHGFRELGHQLRERSWRIMSKDIAQIMDPSLTS